MPHLDEDANAGGRRARRDRNKYAGVEAYLELVRTAVIERTR